MDGLRRPTCQDVEIPPYALLWPAGHQILILDPAGAFLGEFEPGSPNDIAVDRAGFLYTLTASKVTKYEIAL